MENKENLCLVLYPNIKGLGYILCGSPTDLINYGIHNIKPLQSEYTRRLKRLIDNYRPTIIILRGYNLQDYRISERVKKVLRNFELQAEQNDIRVYRYTREQIKSVFEVYGGTNKYGISKTITDWYPELKPRMPDLRKNSKSEHYQMGLFDTFALMLTHYYIK